MNQPLFSACVRVKWDGTPLSGMWTKNTLKDVKMLAK